MGEAVTLDAFLVLNFEKLSRSDALMDTLAERAINARQFMEPIMTRVIEQTTVPDESEVHSTCPDHHRLMLLPLRSPRELGVTHPMIKVERNDFARN